MFTQALYAQLESPVIAEQPHFRERLSTDYRGNDSCNDYPYLPLASACCIAAIVSATAVVMVTRSGGQSNDCVDGVGIVAWMVVINFLMKYSCAHVREQVKACIKQEERNTWLHFHYCVSYWALPPLQLILTGMLVLGSGDKCRSPTRA